MILLPLFLFYKVRRFFIARQEIVVLMYHSVGNSKTFAQQIRYLKNKHYHFLTTEELQREISGATSVKSSVFNNFNKAVLLTFDDGYTDFMTNVLPVLEKEQIPAVVFVHTNRSSENFSHSLPLMDWDEVRTLKQKGVEIGNHSHFHPNMKNLTREEMQAEINNSEEIFSREIGLVPKIFAYPAGKYNQQVIEVLRENNYWLAFTIDEGVVDLEGGPLKIKRIGIDNCTGWLEFRLKLTPAFDRYQNIKKFFGFKK